MSARVRLRDMLRGGILTKWASDRDRGTGNGLFRGNALFFAWAGSGDDWIDRMLQGIAAAWPGNGTPTALPYIGRNRGILRGETETDDSYAARLLEWRSLWRGDLPDGGGAGSQLGLAKAIRGYLGNAPRVRVVNRHGFWTTINADGSIERVRGVTFDWDSVSNPERAGYFWDQWVIVYQTQWPVDGTWGDGETWGGTLGFGMNNDAVAYDAIGSLCRQWKAARTYIRSIIWCYDDTLFDPSNPASLPDGTWGQAHVISGGAAVPSGRSSSCRYWEPTP